jgi:hypothetical protein
VNEACRRKVIKACSRSNRRVIINCTNSRSRFLHSIQILVALTRPLDLSYLRDGRCKTS